jgi:hypothetical protein
MELWDNRYVYNDWKCENNIYGFFATKVYLVKYENEHNEIWAHGLE